MRQDGREGLASGPIRDSEMHVTVANDDDPIQPVYIICFCKEKAAARKFGSHVLRLHDEEQLAERVRASLPDRTLVSWWDVQYSDDATYSENFQPLDIVERQWSTKPTSFAEEVERRMLVVFPPQFKIRNEHIILYVGDLSDISELVPVDPKQVGT